MGKSEQVQRTPLMLAALCVLASVLVGCKKDSPQSTGAGATQSTTTAADASAQTGASGTSPPVGTDPLVAAAQTQLDQRFLNRACTLIVRHRFQAGLETMPEYRKSVLLEHHGLATRSKGETFSVPETVFTYKTDVAESKGQGVFIRDPAGLLYCYGHWTVQQVAPTKWFSAPSGYQANLATVVLSGAPAWVKSDKDAGVLGVPNTPDDMTVLSAFDANRERTDASLTGTNQVPVTTSLTSTP